MEEGPLETDGHLGSFLFQGPRGILEEWVLYGEKIMGRKCSLWMDQSQRSLPFSSGIVYLSSHFSKKISKFFHTPPC